MRELKEYSITENIKYLKAEYNHIYSALAEMVSSATKKFIQVQEEVDDAGDFNSVLSTIKAHVPRGLLIKCEDQKQITRITRNNINCIMDIFESMFLDVIDQHEFNALDPEIQELYFEAQKAIDEEEKDG